MIPSAKCGHFVGLVKRKATEKARKKIVYYDNVIFLTKNF